MNAAPRLIKRLILGLLLVISFAFAQEEDAILQSYSLAFDNLNIAQSAPDSLQSSDALDRAAQALRPLSAESNSTALVAQLETTFERAKQTLQNQSEADLGVQIAVLKGGFQRLVYEAAVASANAGDLATTQARLVRIANDMGLTDEVQNALSAETNLSKLFATFEVATANVVKAHLGNVQGWLEQDKGVAYQTLATAYSDFLIVQDSPRADASSNDLFTESFTALVADDRETLGRAISQLNTQMDTFASAASAVVSGAITSEVPTMTEAPVEVVQPEAVSPVETTETTPEVTTPEPTAQVETTAQPETVAQTETPSTETSTVDATQTEMPAPVVPAEPVIVNPFEDALGNELAALGLSPNQQTALSEKWLDNGFTSVKSVVNELLAKTSLAMSAVQEGDQGFAKGQLADAKNIYDEYLSPVVSDSSLNSSVSNLLSSLNASPSLRQQDLATLNQQWANLANTLNISAPSSSLQGVANGVTGFWSGWPRIIVMIALGLLAFVPLYLLFLAFGGGNRNWQLIGYALFLLLVPVIYEGLSFLLSLINSFVNVSALEVLSRFSFFQNPVMHVVWAVLTGIAILLASMGLYGICVQFGLLGKRNEDLSGTVVETSPSATSIEKAKTTNFEWDEEF
jgi:hypothetical protein